MSPETRPAPENEAIIAELRSRCPGFERSAYRDALVIGIARAQALPAPTLRQHLFYWGVALTFAWGPFVIIPLQKQFFQLPDPAYPWPYPVACGLAALYLSRHRRSGSAFLAVINVLGGLAWLAFLLWAVSAFAASFWK
ncbi:MAG: hypothetical protein NTV51_25410 [Verrucomicrobia bacterium]|nr:hypothetical protein [Verrucomicrobiota bacterium]